MSGKEGKYLKYKTFGLNEILMFQNRGTANQIKFVKTEHKKKLHF